MGGIHVGSVKNGRVLIPQGLEEVGGEWTLVNNTLGGVRYDWSTRFGAGSSVEAVRKAKEGVVAE